MKTAPRNPAYTVDTLLKEVQKGGAELDKVTIRFKNKNGEVNNHDASLFKHFCHALGWAADYERITEDHTTVEVNFR